MSDEPQEISDINLNKNVKIVMQNKKVTFVGVHRVILE